MYQLTRAPFSYISSSLFSSAKEEEANEEEDEEEKDGEEEGNTTALFSKASPVTIVTVPTLIYQTSKDRRTGRKTDRDMERFPPLD